MDKKDLLKISLNNQYEFESKKAIGWFTFGTIALLGFLATMILHEEYFSAIVFGVLIIAFSFWQYDKKKDRVLEICTEIEKLKW